MFLRRALVSANTLAAPLRGAKPALRYVSAPNPPALPAHSPQALESMFQFEQTNKTPMASLVLYFTVAFIPLACTVPNLHNSHYFGMHLRGRLAEANASY
ncbi:hypothetical protein H696_02089 [Fonticula alba]|uniref:Uncharacterized protein n=1 Tax=Fonticula alba TaxID=691883 RepID=A0A058ZB42_FONAL|nr:hypothetical protein H696_02089 [Fonticula alba]KCV71138.1 hypothetical protein H696_02089 [Fonticula alba]|eukprot:XP_009494261.1 hypothetical protein H696_02089 [Fonticula alba]